MSYHVIARKYRPRAFDGVVGQEAVARTLRNAIERSRVAHAYMFCGPRGVGKTSMARIFAKALNCLAADAPTTEPCGTCDLCERVAKGEDLDVLEIDAASNRRVDDARTLIGNVSFHPTRARFKVYIVDEVHMLTTEAFNALLKTLEEPPPHVKFVFATTDPQKVPPTILSRCQRFDFRPVPAADITALLTGICEREGFHAEPEAIQAIARASLGGVRDAESLLEQLSALGAGDVRLADLHALLGTVPAERMRGLFDALATGVIPATLAETTRILDQGTDPGELMRQCMRHAHDLMLVRAQGPRAADVEADEAGRRALADQAAKFSDATLVYAVTLFTEALRNSRQLGEGRLFAETALARLAGHRDMRFLDQMVRELQSLEKRIGQPSSIPEPPPAPGGWEPRATEPPAREPAPAATARAGAGPTTAARPLSTPQPASRIASEAPTETAPIGSAEPVTDVPDPAPDPAQNPVPSVALDVAMVRARWSDVRDAAARGSAFLRATLQAAEVADVRVAQMPAGARTVVVLSFPESGQIHRTKAEDPATRERIEAALGSFFGPGLRVDTISRPDAAAGPAEASGGEPRRTAEAPERLTSAETEAVRSSAVTRLVEQELGGVIVAMQRVTPRGEE